jgi:hypothetical protein
MMPRVSLLLFSLAVGCQLDTEGALTRDLDGDGYSVVDGDCDDGDDGVQPGADEIPYDGIDQDCDGADLIDVDRDGWSAVEAGGADCDDRSPAVNPDAQDSWYDGVDSDCDGADDYDQDGDGHRAEAYDGDDCDDLDAGVNPDAADAWYDGVDSDCDGWSDYDQDRDGHDSVEHGGGDCDDAVDEVNPDAEELPDDNIDNDCVDDPPVISGLALSPEEVYTDDTIVALVESFDPDGDEVEVDYRWYVDGLLVSEGASYLPGSGFTRGQSVYLVATPSAGDLSGTTVTSDVVIISNSTPSISALSLSNTSPTVEDSLSVSIVASDADGDGITYRYDWVVDGLSVASTATLSGDYFAKGQEIYVEVSASDGLVDSGTISSETAMAVNSPPTLTYLLLDRSEVRTDDELGTLTSTVDADGDEVILDFAWWVDGLPVSASGSSLDGGLWFDKGQEIYVVATPSDGEDDGGALESAHLTASNSAPGAPGLLLQPEEPIAGEDDLICLVDVASSDADGDAVSYAFAWTVDGVAHGGATASTTHSADTIPASVYAPGETWACTVTPWDDEEAGSPGSASVEVRCDLDRDGYAAADCGGDDCDDADAGVNPGATEIWYDGVDSDCDGHSDYDQDFDGQDREAEGGADCDDTDDTIFAGAVETWYDGVDQDCDGGNDFDQDGDGVAGLGFGGLDCDDTDASVSPSAEEICGDGVDNDCDGREDLAVPGDYASIQAAIDAATAGDLVCVAAGTYTENLDFGGRSIGLVGVYGSAATLIDGGGVGPVISLASGEGSGTFIQGLTLSNGAATRGGGIYAQGSEASLDDIVITGCSATSGGGGLYLGEATVEASGLVIESCSATAGGGIELDHAVLVAEDASIEGCTASGAGGGIYSEDSDLILELSTVQACSANGYGGGVHFSTGDIDLGGTSVADCDADYGGGAYLISAQGSLEGARLEGNEAVGYGGGLYIHQQGPDLIGVTLSGNVAQSGGGAYLAGASPEVAGSIFEGNSAEFGAGLSFHDAAVLITASHFEGNDASSCGGGVYLEYDSTLGMIEDCIFQGNSADYGAGLYVYGASATVDRSLFVSNEALAGAGARIVGDSWSSSAPPAVDFTNVAFVGNRASDYGGGGLHLSADTLATSFTNVVLRSNEARGSTGGGAILMDMDHVSTFVNVSLSDNRSYTSGGGIEVFYSTVPAMSTCNLYGNAPDDVAGMSSPVGSDGNVALEPAYLDTSGSDPLAWDLHLSTGSGLIDAGDPSLSDHDGGTSDIGIYGGPGGAGWDLDGDGYPAWYQPGAYDASSYPAAGWDCDDQDASVFPGAGC